jgi:hypothetical protein
MRAVKGSRSNRRWHYSSTLKLKELLWRPKLPISGLGMEARRFQKGSVFQMVSRFYLNTEAH